MTNAPMRMSAGAESSAPSAVHSSTTALRSTQGIDALIETACARFEPLALTQAFSPLFPEHLPWQSLAEVPRSGRQLSLHVQGQLTHITQAVAAYRQSLTASAGA